MKNCNDTIGNRIRDLPASSTVPQTTATPRALQRNTFICKIFFLMCITQIQLKLQYQLRYKMKFTLEQTTMARRGVEV